MKTFLITLALTVTLTAHAAPSLKDNMEAASDLYTAIKRSVGDRDQNSANAVNAGKMAELFAACGPLVPDSLSDLPPPQKSAALQEYKKMIATIAAQARGLRAAFQKNDNQAAADIVNQMNLGKREGHTKFK